MKQKVNLSIKILKTPLEEQKRKRECLMLQKEMEV